MIIGPRFLQLEKQIFKKEELEGAFFRWVGGTDVSSPHSFQYMDRGLHRHVNVCRHVFLLLYMNRHIRTDMYTDMDIDTHVNISPTFSTEKAWEHSHPTNNEHS